MTFGPDYDRWLDAELERRACADDAYQAWVEENDLDPDEDHTVAFEQAMEDAAEDHAERMAEERADRDRYGDDW